MEYTSFMFWGVVIFLSCFLLFVIYKLIIKPMIDNAIIAKKKPKLDNKMAKLSEKEMARLNNKLFAQAIAKEKTRVSVYNKVNQDLVAQTIANNKNSKEILEKKILYGIVNPIIICPQCQMKGYVHTKPFEKKNGISGAKATGAILTGGISLLLTGLSQTDNVTQAHCENCNTDWVF